jgi:hypothetical protein
VTLTVCARRRRGTPRRTRRWRRCGRTSSRKADAVNDAWRAFQRAAVEGSRERDERDDAVARVRRWVQRWRPVVLLAVPGAADNLRALPPAGASPDEVLQVARDLADFIAGHAAAFAGAAAADLGADLTEATRENREAVAAYPAELAAREAFAHATVAANPVVVHGSEVVRAVLEPHSPEYRQFLARSAATEEDEDDSAAATGEEGASTTPVEAAGA